MMVNRMVVETRQQEVFSHEETPAEQCAPVAFLRQAGLSYLRIEPFVD
jgi:hypothetical protein